MTRAMTMHRNTRAQGLLTNPWFGIWTGPDWDLIEEAPPCRDILLKWDQPLTANEHLFTQGFAAIERHGVKVEAIWVHPDLDLSPFGDGVSGGMLWGAVIHNAPNMDPHEVLLAGPAKFWHKGGFRALVRGTPPLEGRSSK